MHLVAGERSRNLVSVKNGHLRFRDVCQEVSSLSRRRPVGGEWDGEPRWDAEKQELAEALVEQEGGHEHPWQPALRSQKELPMRTNVPLKTEVGLNYWLHYKICGDSSCVTTHHL